MENLVNLLVSEAYIGANKNMETCLKEGLVFKKKSQGGFVGMGRHRVYLYIQTQPKVKTLMVADINLNKEVEKASDRGFLDFAGYQEVEDLISRISTEKGYVATVDTLVSYYGPYEMGFKPA